MYNYRKKYFQNKTKQKKNLIFTLRLNRQTAHKNSGVGNQQWRIQQGAKGAFAPSWKPKIYMFFNKILNNFKKFNKNSQIFTEIASP